MLVQLFKAGCFCLAVFFVGCASETAVEDSGPGPVANISGQYEIGVGDTLTINVWRNEELTMTIPVRPDGKISMPLIGDVQAAGVSAAELSDSLKSKLINFIRNPQVTVIVLSAESSNFQNRVRVTGAVDTPISIPYRDGMTVLDVVLEAGGLTEFARGNGAKLFRKTDSGIKAYNIRVLDILNKGDLTTNHRLAPSDIVTVPERLF